MSHSEVRMDRRLHLPKKRGRPLAWDPQLGGDNKLGAAHRGQGKVGGASGGGQGWQSYAREGARTCVCTRSV
jgi:hypothetical protein